MIKLKLITEKYHTCIGYGIIYSYYYWIFRDKTVLTNLPTGRCCALMIVHNHMVLNEIHENQSYGYFEERWENNEHGCCSPPEIIVSMSIYML